jgi:pyruvate dehydrogenase E2 component (dihydrolipoamide acetyltransferase)
MATKVFMEALSPTMEEGRVVKWTRREGDAVKTGDTLAEVETDKAVMELVARADGQLLKIAAAEGATVPVGAVVAYIGAPGEVVDELAAGAPAASPGSIAPADATRVKASPLAKRIAKEQGVDLKLVLGSGPGGRVVRRDIEGAERLVTGGSREHGAVPPAAPRPVVRQDVLLPAPGSLGAVAGAGYEDLPLTQIRKTIARRLVTSLGPVPHFFLTAEADMERAAEARDALNRGREGEARVSFNDIIIKATALALTRHPACNAWFQDDHIRQWRDVHIGMAVAIEDGLITPVIRHADRRSLAEIGATARELAERARSRRLSPEEYTGSTFSISNLGMFGIDQFTAVINPPEAAILAVGAITPKPVAVEGGGQVTVRRRLRLTLSCDHRVIDGATGAAFMQTLSGMLENPLAML